MSKKHETMGNTLEAGYTPSEEVPEGYKRTEVGVIPEDWRVSTIGAEFRTQLGKMLDAAKNTGVPKPYIGNRSVQWGRIDLDGIATVPMSMSDLQRFRLRRGDLLVCEGGEIGRAAIWNDLIPECYYQKAIHRLRPVKTYNVYLMMCLLQLWTSNGYLSNYVTQTSIAHLPKDKLEIVPLPVPPDAEQHAIAEALSDVDGLLAALEALIAQKRAIKQAAMQQLLTGKTRLPGFCGKWETKQLGEIASFFKGSGLSKADLSLYGRQRCIHYGELFTLYGERITKVLHGTDRVGTFFYSVHNDVLMPTSDVTPNGLATASCILASDVIIGADVLVIRAPESVLNGEFLAYAIKVHRDQVMQLVSGTTVFHLYGRDMANFTFAAPDVDEQSAIVTILSDMDAEIDALERRRDKAQAIKQGMMQQLLTGRVRLIQPEARSVGRKHNWQFNEAVVISVLAKHFGNEQYPLGRMRYTKLSYLLHRYEEGHAEGYLKKAAGPYNPQTRYRGPEKIALEKDYVRQHRSSKGQGFIASSNFDEAEGYFDKWYGSEVLQWLERFRYRKNNYLELLTTVDMAAEELREAGEEVFVESIKEVIRGHPEWNPKLDRPIFSDTNLASAIESCQKLFDY